MKVARLHNRIQNFAWGSESFLPELLGQPNPEGRPQAELWMGVHPLGESHIAADAPAEAPGPPLSQYLLDSNGKLDAGIGADTAARYQSLPFLFKVLAARQPLSIQAHPNKAQAEQGFERENAAGIPLRDPGRNYKDPNHKPEIALALTPFRALCGFRPLAQIEENFRSFAGGLCDELLDFSGHRHFFASLQGLQKEEAAEQKAILLQAAAQHSSDAVPEWQWFSRLAQFYPGDLGALAPLYLHLFCLEPGQAVYLPAGILHAYLEGSAMELMANSDNVLRGGLTPKHQDLPELMKTLLFEEFELRIIEACEMDLHRSYYPVSAAEFRLEYWRLRPEDSALYFPQKHPVMLAFVYRGSVEINGLPLRQGQSCVIPAGCGELTARVATADATAELYVAAAKDI